jgi:arylsulfatase
MGANSQLSFVIVKYQGRSGAAEALSRLVELEGEGVVEIADAVVVYKNRRGKIKLRQTPERSPRKASALGGAAGLVIGAALGAPIALAALGGVAGGAVTRLRDSGVGTATMRALGEELSVDDSALALLITSADWQALRDRMTGFDHEILVAEFTGEAASAVTRVIADDEAAAAVVEELSGPDGGYNFLVLTCDQHNAYLPSPPDFDLPHHDRLDAAGLRFEGFQVSTALCTPSRSVMYTGMHTPLSGMWDNTNMAWIDDMDPAKQTVGHMLRQAGYYTAFKGKWHLSDIPAEGAEDGLEPYGFSDFQSFGEVWGDVQDGYRWDPEIAADAAKWLTEKAPNIAESQPWFLAVNLCNPHDIMYYDADPIGDTQTEGGALLDVRSEPDDPLYQRRWDTELPDSFDDPLTQHPAAASDFVRDSELAFGPMPPERHDMWHNYLNYYLNCLRDVDRHIGTILDALEASGQADDTIIVFTADHGDMLAAHGMRQKGIVPFREEWNVPFVVVHPDYLGGRATNAVGSTVDMVPTLLALAGVTARQRRVLYPQLKGEDLSEVVADPDSDGPRGSRDNPGKGCLMTYDTLSSIDFEFVAGVAALLVDTGEAGAEEVSDEPSGKVAQARELFETVRRADFSQRHVLRGVYDGRHKLVRYFAINEHNQPESIEELYTDNDVALYDLVDDPTEMNNIANRENADYDEALVAEMNTKLNELIRVEIGADANLVERPFLTFVTAGIKQRGK